MTDIATAAAQLGAAETAAKAAEKVAVTAEPNTRLEQLCAQYDLAHAEAKKAEEALKAITDGIKNELAAVGPDAKSVEVDSPDLARPLRMIAVESWRLDTERFKKDHPLTFAMYASKSTSYQLRRVG